FNANTAGPFSTDIPPSLTLSKPGDARRAFSASRKYGRIRHPSGDRELFTSPWNNSRAGKLGAGIEVYFSSIRA
ncbi:hypothetical protein, partial [Mesorhizobium sp. M7A.F.Ca.CA.001.12.2.1]|uniref:hypothetical protein n=1 Tax=Mesorhizobium sp. M7A.F.Ca.CA.001.12.2.1 TaxID=2496725 RepID=UPI0019D0E0FD